MILPSWAAIFFLTVFSFLLPLHFGTRGFVFFDQSMIIDGAWRILLGQVPYRDFSVYFGPLLFYLQALFFKVFGMQLYSGVIHAAVMNMVATLVTYWGMRRLMGASVISSLGGSLLTALWFYSPMSWPWFDITGYLFLMISLLLVWRGGKGSLFLSGFFCALTWLCKANVAAVSSMVLPIVLYFFRRNLKKEFFYFITGYFFILFGWFTYLMVSHSLGSAWQDLVVRPNSLGRIHSLWHFPWGLVQQYPPVLTLLLVQALAFCFFFKDADVSRRKIYFSLMILSLVSFVGAQTSSVDFHAHFVFVGWIWAGLSLGIFFSQDIRPSLKSFFVFLMWLILFLGGLRMSAERWPWQYGHIHPEGNLSTVHSPAFRHLWIQEPYAQDVDELLRWAQDELKEEDHFLVLPSMTLLYFVLKKEPPLPFVFLHERFSLQRKLHDEKRMMESLKKVSPKWLILETREQLPHLHELFEYFPTFYRLLQQQYVPYKALSGYMILKHQ